MLRLFDFGKYLAKYYILAISFAVLGFLITIAIPVYLVYLFFVVKPDWIHLVILCVLAIARGLMRYGEHYYGHYVAFHVLAKFRRLVFNKLRDFTPSKLDNQSKGQLLKVIGEDIEALEVFFAHTFPPIMTATINIIILMIYFINVNVAFALVALLTYVLLAVVIPLVFAKYLQPLLLNQNEIKKKYTDYFLQVLNGIFDLVMFNKTKQYFSKLNERSVEVNAIEKQVATVGLVQSASSFLVIGLMIMVFAIVAFNQVNTITALTSLIVFTSSFAPFLGLARLPLGLKRSLNAASDIFALFDEVVTNKTGDKVTSNIETITTKQLSFSYENRDQIILKNVNLELSEDKIIGIVGKSGSGKSTLVKLIMKWYIATLGKIQINEVNINELDPNKLQENICYIPQYPKIFNQTIRENLTLGNAIAEDKIIEICRKCNIWDVIEKLDEKLDTPLRFDSKIFSAGELQRLELARAFLKNANCYIFDEPTSNLDSLNEAMFLKLIKENCKGMVILISHRKSTTSIADEVYQVEDGIFKRV